jgi:hypothetical protein
VYNTRQLGFHFKSDFRSNNISADAESANVFYRLVFATWKVIYNNGNEIRDPPVLDLLIHTSEYATNERYLHHEKSYVTNNDIVEFTKKCLKQSVFVGNAFGIKNAYQTNPKGYTNTCSVGKVTLFAKKATDMISESLHENFNTDAYPDHMLDDDEFGHRYCPVVYGVDIGHEVSPLKENCSYVTSGFYAKRYIEENIRVTKSQSIINRAQWMPTGMFFF